MITNRDLDRQLGSWFEARATSLPPDGLLERAMAGVGSTRQRPGWLVPDRWRSSDGRTRPTSTPARVVLVLVTLLVVAIAAAAVGAWLNRPTTAFVVPPAVPSPSGLIVATPLPSEAAPSPTDQPTPTPNRAASVRIGTFAGLTDFLAASDTVAWAATPLGLYRTADTGKTWTDADPEGWSSHTAVSLIDGDTVYIASGGSSARIIATHDAGASWIQATLNMGAISGGPFFSFQTPLNGFATFFDPNGTNPLHVYGTTDGGATWSGPVTGSVPHMAESMGKLYGPVGGFMYQSAGKADNKPFDNRFFLSADGGATWTQYTYPIGGALAPKDAMKGISDIFQEEDGRLLLSIGVDGGRHAIPQALYESGDDPASWRLVAQLPDTFDVQFLSAADWVLTSDHALSEVRSTSDGGAHWQITKASASIYNLGGYQFASSETGWATEECRYADPPIPSCDRQSHAHVLLVTRDGGATWTRIGD